MKTHRRPATKDKTEPTAASDEGLNIGLAEPALPGGINHIQNHPVADHPEVVKVEPPYYSGMMTHGVYVQQEPHGDPKVYPEGGRITPDAEQRAQLEATKSAPIPEPSAESLPPVRVIVVPDASSGHDLLTLYTNLIPVQQGDPIMICARDPKRTNVYLLNEDTSNGVRFSTEWPLVSSGGGALLPPSMTGYLRLKCQERIYASPVSGTSPVYISIILETVLDSAVP
ncbi:MAG: hypothetical protein ACREHG_05975 [Candidatus Saccharimonadales bacterium]